MSENAEVVANAIATYLVEVGVLSIGDQVAAIRRQYAQTWRHTLARAGFDACHGMPVCGKSHAAAMLAKAVQP